MGYFKVKIIVKSHVNGETERKTKRTILVVGPVYFNEKNLGVVYKKIISSDEFKDCERKIALIENADFKIEIKPTTKGKYEYYIKKINKNKQKEKLKKQKAKLKRQKTKVNRQKARIKKQKEKLKKQKEKLKKQKIKVQKQRNKIKRQKMRVRNDK